MVGAFLFGKVIECVSQINTGAKYNDDVFQFSVGLNGVGTEAVNALSSSFYRQKHHAMESSSKRDFYPRASSKRRKRRERPKRKTAPTSNSLPDTEIFKKFSLPQGE